MADDANSTKPMGRPLKFQTVEELQQKIDEYFQTREPFIAKTRIKIMKADGSHYWKEDEELIPARAKTMQGLANALDIDRHTLINYKEKPEFFASIARAKAQCAEYAEEQLFSRNANGASFALKNNYGWKDESTVNTRTVEEDLDAIDDLNDEKADVADEAAKALAPAETQNEPGSAPTG